MTESFNLSAFQKEVEQELHNLLVPPEQGPTIRFYNNPIRPFGSVGGGDYDYPRGYGESWQSTTVEPIKVSARQRVQALQLVLAQIHNDLQELQSSLNRLPRLTRWLKWREHRKLAQTEWLEKYVEKKLQETERAALVEEEQQRQEQEEWLEKLLELEPGQDWNKANEQLTQPKAISDDKNRGNAQYFLVSIGLEQSRQAQEASLTAKGMKEREAARQNEKLEKDRQQIKRAKELLTRQDIRAYLCPALQTVSGDVFTIANTITQVLAPLAIAGALSIPLEPVLFASIALVISRVGIASICADYKKEDKEKK